MQQAGNPCACLTAAGRWRRPTHPGLVPAPAASHFYQLNGMPGSLAQFVAANPIAKGSPVNSPVNYPGPAGLCPSTLQGGGTRHSLPC